MVVGEARRLGIAALLERAPARRSRGRSSAGPPRRSGPAPASRAGAGSGHTRRRARCEPWRRRRGRGWSATGASCPRRARCATRPSPGSTSTASISYSRTVPGQLGEQAGDGERQRVTVRVHGMRGSGIVGGHRRPAARLPPPGRRLVHGPAHTAAPLVGSPSARAGRTAARRSSSMAIPRSMPCSVRATSASRAARTPAAYSSAPPRTWSPSSSASAMIRRLSSSAASVRPALPDQERGLLLGARDDPLGLLLGLLDDPLALGLIRLAARTSSGTATRSSSMRLRAASRSMIAFCVMRQRLAVRDQRLEALDEKDDVQRTASRALAAPAGRPTGLWHAPAPRTSACRQGVAQGDRRHRVAASSRRRLRTGRSP